MKTNWLPATILTLLVFLVPLAAQASQSAPAVQAAVHSPACEHNADSPNCCDCCLACDAVAAKDICSLLCGATATAPQPATGIVGLRDRRSPWSRPAGRVHHADPPEPFPPRDRFAA